jgi:hypothetical protein
MRPRQQMIHAPPPSALAARIFFALAFLNMTAAAPAHAEYLWNGMSCRTLNERSKADPLMIPALVGYVQGWMQAAQVYQLCCDGRAPDDIALKRFLDACKANPGITLLYILRELPMSFGCGGAMAGCEKWMKYMKVEPIPYPSQRKK